MNVKMWRNFATRRNIDILKQQAIHFIGPTTGHLASLITADGRMVEPAEIFAAVISILGGKADLRDKKIIITAGPTIEPLDPVRLISNRSSGKMGYAIADAARSRGAEVVLISGPVYLDPPAGASVVKVETARQMLEAVRRQFKGADALIMAAAVTDYRPEKASPGKIKKRKPGLTLKLIENPDILKTVSSGKGKKVIVGFALETENIVANAKKKLADKKLDLIVANNPTVKGAEFGSDNNKAILIKKSGKPVELPLMRKTELAHRILDEVAIMFKRKN